ncbi:MAG: LysR family transcriptional regulator [Sporomusaceae bacterium]|nr:LysR family transcriptional regulator [Sporomusaceae bacterium]
MDIQFFHTFLMVAKLGNMTQAAEKLNFSQPTITGQIRVLEQHFGVRLFDRVGKKLFITDAGQELIAYAEKLLATYDDAYRALSTHPDSLNLGIGATAAAYILFPRLQQLQQMHKCSVTMEMCHVTTAVVKGITENRFDLGFVQNGIPAECLNGFEVLKEQLVWVVQAKLAAQRGHSENILDYPLLGYKAGGSFRTLYENSFGSKPVDCVIEYNDSETMKNAILQGLGCGALPLIMIKPLLKAGVLLEFTAMPRPGFSVWVVFRRDKKLSRAAEYLLELFREEPAAEAVKGSAG